MKVFAISDLHLSLTCNKPMNIFGPVWEGHFEQICKDWREKVKEDDVVLIAGDISWAMKLEDAIIDLREIGKLPGKIIITKGNHDYWWKSLQSIRNELPQNMFALQNDSIKFGNVVFCGTRGWTVSENGEYSSQDQKIFNRELIRLELSLKDATNKLQEGDTLVCMIHYPPFNSKMEHSEFMKLFEKYNVKKVIYGHLHGKNCKALKYVKINEIEYYLTSCDQVQNKLTQIL